MHSHSQQSGGRQEVSLDVPFAPRRSSFLLPFPCAGRPASQFLFDQAADFTLMVYARYFKPGQKILVRVAESTGRFEALSATFQESDSGCFDLLLTSPTREEEGYPFAAGMPLELMSDHLGLGLRLTGRFQQHVADNRIRVELVSGLQVFQRRLHRRLDINVGLRYTKGRGTLRSFRQQWEKNLQILEQTQDFSKLPPFPRTHVNLSAGGIRFELAPPIEAGDLCLILLQLEPASRPICALNEVVWLNEPEGDHRRIAGMQFICILDADKKRIEALIRQAGDAAKEPRWNS